MFDIFSSVMFDGNITPSLESPFFKDLNDACCISGVQIQPAKIKFKSTTSKSKMSLRGPERDYFHIYWSKPKIIFYTCVIQGRSASLTIAREKQT